MSRVPKLALQAVAIAVVASMIALLGWRVVTHDRAQGIADAIAAGKTPAAPDFDLPLLDGTGRVVLSSLRGKAVVLNFWASWCLPCKDEAPRLQAAWEKWRDRGVVFVGVDAQDFRGDAKRFVARYRLTYPIVHDGRGSTLGRFGVSGFPETWFVDREGRLVGARIQGPVSARELDDNIRLALGDAS